MKVGDKVICVDGNFDSRASKYFTALPVEGEFYHIRDLRTQTLAFGKKSVLLEEITNPLFELEAFQGKTEPRFNVERFRVVDPITNLIIENEYELVST